MSKNIILQHYIQQTDAAYLIVIRAHVYRENHTETLHPVHPSTACLHAKEKTTVFLKKAVTFFKKAVTF